MIKKTQLTVVIPATKVRPNLDSLTHNLIFTKKYGYKVVLIHDIKDDESSDLLKNLLCEYENVLLIEGHFGSAGLARNQAIPYLDTDWVVFWDSDDKVIPNNFLHLLNKTQTEESFIGIGNFETVNHQNLENLKFNKMSKLKTNVVTHPGLWRYIFNMESISGLKFSNSTYGEDVQFICEVLSRNPKITTANIPIYQYKTYSETQATFKVDQTAFNLAALQRMAILIIEGSLDKQNLILKIFIRQNYSLIKRSKLKLKIKITLSEIKLLLKQKTTSRINAIFMLFSVLIKPEIKIFNNCERRLNSIYLHGGLGNQLFQLSEMMERFSVNEFDVISNSKNIFDKYNLTCPEKSPITQNKILNYKISRLVERKAINFVLKLNYLAQMDLKSLNFAVKVFEKAYLYFLQITVFRGYIIVSDSLASNNFSSFSSKPYLFIGYFQSKKNNLSESTIEYLKSLFEFDARKKITEYRSLQVKDNPLIIHIRLGDYKEFRNLDVLDGNYFSEAIGLMNELFEYNKIWLFSNDPSRAVTFLPKYLIEKTVNMENISDNDLDKFQLMRLGKAYIISNSTYSWWAVRLSENFDPMVIAPSRWFNMQRNPQDLIPNKWRLI